MTGEEIKQKVLAFGDWEHWADRPFRGAFVLSLFRGGGREIFQKIGLDADWPAALFQKGAWYKSEKVWNKSVEQLVVNMPNVDIFKIVSNCEDFYKRGSAEIEGLLSSEMPVVDKLIRVSNILYEDIAYMWATHGYEHFY